MSATARILIASQAPGSKVHESGIPFSDASGDRLREWMGVSSEEFYDASRVAIVPMGFCYPGRLQDGGDAPLPRRQTSAMSVRFKSKRSSSGSVSDALPFRISKPSA